MSRPLTGTSGVARAAELLLRARSVVVLTGAGVSAESGVATFRDAQTGLWARYDPMTLASPGGFAADPGLVWRWYMARFGRALDVTPNPGHRALARLEAWFEGGTAAETGLPARDPGPFAIFTQNVDDLHERAGSLSVHHLHGSIHRYRCNACDAPHLLRPEDRAAETPPLCAHCGDLVRPDVVWFGEPLPAEVLAAADRAARTCDVMLVAGTSGLVYPAAMLPQVALQAGASVIEVNPEETPVSRSAEVCLRGPSGAMLPAVLDALAASPAAG